MNILIVDDEPITASNLRIRLRQNKWNVTISNNFDNALKEISSWNFDVIICDYFLSKHNKDKQWTDLIKKIREQSIKTPIILLTWRSVEEIAPWSALNSWADDFIQKPYNIQELLARITALIRRQYSWNAINIIKKDNIEMDIITRETTINDKKIKLWNTLSLILLKLLESKWKILSYRDLISYIWWENSLYLWQTSWTLRVHMTNLKKRLWKNIAEKIETVNWVWYKFK